MQPSTHTASCSGKPANSDAIMFEVNSSSWLLFVPAFTMGFYAANQWFLATGLMDPMIPMLFGTSPEMLPILLGPIGKALWVGV